MLKKMKRVIKEAVSVIFRYSGIPYLIHRYLCKNKATVLIYHNPDSASFKRHIDYLRERFSFISLDLLVNAIHHKDWSMIPPNALVITIDDGYRENKKLLPIFIKDHINPTIYLCSHIVNTYRTFWFQSGINNVHALKWVDNDRRLTVLKEIGGFEQEKEHKERVALNFEEIRQMYPFVDFQSHSKFHSILPMCSDQDCEKEVAGAKERLGKMLDKDIKHFSYPSGRYSKREISYLRKSGYLSGRTCDIGWNDMRTDVYRLKGMMIDDNASVNVLSAQIYGFFEYFRYLRKGNLKGKHPQ